MPGIASRPVARIFWVVFGVLVLVTGVALFRTFGLESRQLRVDPAPDVPLDADGIARRLGEALQFRTVSWTDWSRVDGTEFERFHGWLEESYPETHAELELEEVGAHGLLFRWPGTSPEVGPIVLMAHQDVVPVLEGTEQEWRYPAFSGARAEGAVWGRGALDDKGSMIAILEAVEALARDGHRPGRTVYLAFGHDEEVGGERGAAAIAGLLESRGVEPSLVLDEGGILARDLFPLDAPIATIGVAEKGYVTLILTARGAGGHSSMPPPETAVTVLAEALTRLRDHPFPAEIVGPTEEMFETLAPELGFGARFLFANRWLTGRLLERFLAAEPTTAAMLRTTVAPTMLAASEKDNVLPIEASAHVNFRIHPDDSIESVVEHVREVVDELDIDVAVADGFGSEPSPVSPTDSEAYRLLARTVREVFPDAVVTPFLVMGGTDARHMTGLTPNVFRFIPIEIGSDMVEGIHGTGEHVDEEALVKAVRFYRRLIENLSSREAGMAG